MNKQRRSVLVFLAVIVLMASPSTPCFCDGPSLTKGAKHAAPTTAGDLIHADRVLIIAHRGDSGSNPENTLPSFKSAVKAGSDLVELDYIHTSDGIPLVIHDATLDRTTDAVMRWGGKHIKVSSKTLAELRTLDAGSWYDRRFAETRLPTLEEALDVIQKGSVTLIERKGGDAKTCLDLLRRKKFVDHVVVQSFYWDFLRDCRKLSPNLMLAALGFGVVTQDKVDEIVGMDVQAVGWSQGEMDRRWIDEFHRHGLRVWVYTVNDIKRVDELTDAGVDGIITNEPAMMKGHVAVH